MAKHKILITGASSGLGRGTALGLAAAGHRVTAGAETWPQVRQLRSDAKDAGVNLSVIKLDLLDGIDIAHAAEIETDVLVLNAGIQESGAVVDIPIERVRDSFEVNVFGHLRLVQSMAPAMVKRKRGRIVWMSSIAGLQPIPFLGAYSATKHAIEALAGTMRLELAPLGISVATIAPAIFDTGFNDTGMESMNQWRDPATALVPVPDPRIALKFQSEPQPMIDAMIEAISARKQQYRTMRPESAIAEVTAAQAAQWIDRVG